MVIDKDVTPVPRRGTSGTLTGFAVNGKGVLVPSSTASSSRFLSQTSQCLRGLCMEKGRMHVMALGAGSQYFLEEWESRSSMR